MHNNRCEKISVVVSVFNEEEVIKNFYSELNLKLQHNEMDIEILFVDDGSIDKSCDILYEIAALDDRVTVINFSKNFGHEAAMLAGIDHSNGDAVICMDADLQHPPESINVMIEKFKEGYEIINMVRKDYVAPNYFKKLFSQLFYYLINKISPYRFEPNASDFFLISKKVVTIFRNNFREQARFLRGFVQIVGFKKTTVDFMAPKRFAGESKYSFLKLLKFSLSTIFTFSNLPLRLGIFSGVTVGLFSLAVGVYSIIMWARGNVPSGYTTLVVLVSFLFAVQLSITGIIGEYLGYIFRENKRRPIYIIENKFCVKEYGDKCDE